MLRVVSIVGTPDQFGNIQLINDGGSFGEEECGDDVTEEGF